MLSRSKDTYAVTIEQTREHHIVVPPDAKRLHFVGAAGPFSIGGLSGGADGRLLRLLNTRTFFPITIINEDEKSLPENRIDTRCGTDLTPPSNQSAILLEYIAGRWVLVECWPMSANDYAQLVGAQR